MAKCAATSAIVATGIWRGSGLSSTTFTAPESVLKDIDWTEATWRIKTVQVLVDLARRMIQEIEGCRAQQPRANAAIEAIRRWRQATGSP